MERLKIKINMSAGHRCSIGALALRLVYLSSLIIIIIKVIH